MNPVGGYAVNKILSLGLPFAFVGLLLVFYTPQDPTMWWILIVAAHLLGYMHFVMGYYYQGRSIIKKPNVRMKVWFVLLTVLAAFVSYLFIATGNIAALSIIAILYFLIHGALNELTLMQQQMGIAPQLQYFVSLPLFLTPFFLLSLTHPSFFFTPQLEFLNPPPEIAVKYLETIISIDALVLISAVLFGLFFLLVPAHLIFKGAYRAGVSIALITIATVAVIFSELPLNYVILYFITLAFHFLSWSIYFYQVFKTRAPERLPMYLLQHALIVVPLIALSGLALTGTRFDALHEAVFDGTIFITMSMIHITTALLNDDWFTKLIRATS